MQPQAVGNGFVASWIAVAVLYDCWAYFVWGQPAATISDTLRSWAQWSPLVLIPLGGLLWHLFGARRDLMLHLYAWDPLLCLAAGMVLYETSGINSLPSIGPPLN